MTIHTFGDSHSSYGWKNIPTININSIFGKLCYSIGRDGFDKFNIKNLNLNERQPVKDGDIVIFSAGEIDCRCHIHKYITDENSYQNIINSIIEKYFIIIKANIDQFNNLKVYIYNVVPPIRNSDTTFKCSTQPLCGTNESRKTYTLYFNETLKEYCLDH